jgi:anti-sigma regulatory factor (Ser/Thr protein kinase)
VGADAGDSDRFSITVPSRAGLVGTIRAFASAVGRHYGLDDGLVEDVKLAISEACTDPVQAGAGGEISVTVRADGSGLACEVTSQSWEPSAVEGSRDLPESVDPMTLDRLNLVRALFPDADRVERGDTVKVRFSTSSRGV